MVSFRKTGPLAAWRSRLEGDARPQAVPLAAGKVGPIGHAECTLGG
jgi:hypothetical protein